MIFWLVFLGMVALRLVALRLRRKAHLGPLAPLRLSRGREGEGEGEGGKERERKEEGKGKEKEGGRRGLEKGKRKKEKGKRKGEGGAARLWPRGLAFFLLGPCLFLEICTFAF